VIGAAPNGQGHTAVSRRRLLVQGVAATATATLAACGVGKHGTAPSSASADGTPRGAVGLAIVGIITADISRSLRFYRQLGFDVPATWDGDSYRLNTTDNHVLFWETHTAIHAFDPAWSPPPPGDRRIVLEFGFASPDDLDTTYRTLADDGAPRYLAPFDQGGGVRYAIVADPDGNQVSLRYPAS